MATKKITGPKKVYIRKRPLLQTTVDQDVYDKILAFKEKDDRPTVANAVDVILKKGLEYIALIQKAA